MDSFLSIYFVSCYECCCGIFRCMIVLIFPCIITENTQQTNKIKSFNPALIYPQKKKPNPNNNNKGKLKM